MASVYNCKDCGKEFYRSFLSFRSVCDFCVTKRELVEEYKIREYRRKKRDLKDLAYIELVKEGKIVETKKPDYTPPPSKPKQV